MTIEMARSTCSSSSPPPSSASRSSSPAPSSIMSANQTSSTVPSSAASSSMTSLTADDFLPRQPSPDTALYIPDTPASQDVDPQIIEALKSKDRLYVLKLGEIMENLITERRSHVDLAPSTSYQRLLVHRCSAFYRLIPESDPVTKGIFVSFNSECRIPGRRLADLVPIEQTNQPAFKIMRRGSSGRRTKTQSRSGSAAGDEADLSDIEASEAGSIGGRSSATGGSSSKKRMTIAQREAAYNEARSRIFMDFDEKEKARLTSASSSTMSLISGSTSAGGGSSVGDFDDSLSAGSPPTESEYSASAVRDMPDMRRGSTNASSTSSRSLRSSAPSFGSGPSSSRNSRAPSPSFSYPNIYDPQGDGNSSYDPSQIPSQAIPGFAGQVFYPYPPPPPNSGYLAPYYPYPYPYPPPQQNPQNMVDPSSPPSGELFSPPPQPGFATYMWQQSNQHPMPPPLMQQAPPQVQSPQTPNPASLPPPNSQYPQQFMAPPPPGYGYPPVNYQYTNAPMTAPPIQMSNQLPFDIPRQTNMNGAPNPMNQQDRNGSNNSLVNQNRSMTRSGSVNSNKPHSAPVRGLWNASNNNSGGTSVGDAIGPRMNTVRRVSNDRNMNKSSPPSDEVSSVASSSTTSSSSRRTYTSSVSTTSSQHPLPPRPDWAVGLKPQPTLHQSANSSRNMSPASGPRNGNNAHRPHIPHQFQSTDFPPLGGVSAAQEKRNPLAGVWGNNLNTPRAVLQPSPMHSNTSPANTVCQPPVTAEAGQVPSRFDEFDRSYERPPPKAAELFNPRTGKRPISKQGPSSRPQSNAGPSNGALVVEIGAVSLEDPPGSNQTQSEVDQFSPSQPS